MTSTSFRKLAELLLAFGCVAYAFWNISEGDSYLDQSFYFFFAAILLMAVFLDPKTKSHKMTPKERTSYFKAVLMGIIVFVVVTVGVSVYAFFVKGISEVISVMLSGALAVVILSGFLSQYKTSPEGKDLHSELK